MKKQSTETQQERQARIIRERIATQAPKGFDPRKRTVTTKALKNPRATMTGEFKTPKGWTENGMLHLVVYAILVMVVVVVVVAVLNSPFVAQFNACNAGDLLETAKCLSAGTPTPMP